MAENGSASAIAVSQWMRISGIGLFISITAPSTMATAPPTPRIPCEVNFASSTNSVNASSSSAAPSQLMGSTEMRRQSQQHQDARRPLRARSGRAR